MVESGIAVCVRAMHKSILKSEDRQRLSPAYFKESLQEFYIKKNCKLGHVCLWMAVCPLGRHFIYSLCGSQRLERGGRQRNQELNCKVGKAQAMSRDQLCLEEIGQTFRQGDLGVGPVRCVGSAGGLGREEHFRPKGTGHMHISGGRNNFLSVQFSLGLECREGHSSLGARP